MNKAINAEPTNPQDSVPKEEIIDSQETEGGEGFETAGEQRPIAPDDDPYAGLPNLVRKEKNQVATENDRTSQIVHFIFETDPRYLISLRPQFRFKICKPQGICPRP